MANLDGFEQFYAAYFRRDARKDAIKAWGQVDGDAHLDAILAALAWQTPDYLKKERQFRPLPASWLRGERWDDEHPQAVIDATRVRDAAAAKAEADRQNAINEQRDREWREAQERRRA